MLAAWDEGNDEELEPRGMPNPMIFANIILTNVGKAYVKQEAELNGHLDFDSGVSAGVAQWDERAGELARAVAET